MGLDQYAFLRTKDGNQEENEFFYWRKHNRLQGFMEKLWRDKNPDIPANEEFYGLELSQDDLDKLEDAVKSEALPKTSGFFFGEDSYADPVRKLRFQADDLEFINTAREYLKEGYVVVYDSSW